MLNNKLIVGLSPERGFSSYSQGRKRVKVMTLGNVEVSLATVYVLSRPGRGEQNLRRKKRQKGQRGTSKGQGFYPLLRWLAMEQGVSPLVWATVAAQGMLSTSGCPSAHQFERLGHPIE